MKEILFIFDNKIITNNKLINKKDIAINQNCDATQHFIKRIKLFPDRCFSIGESNFIPADTPEADPEK